MSGSLDPLLSWFVSIPGLLVLSALDSSIAFYLPFALDGVLVYLVASRPDLFWLFPLLATAGALAGSAPTWWVGARLGTSGLERLISEKRADRLRRRASDRTEVAMALPAVVPPPFPFTPYILAGGALDLDAGRFFGVMAGARILRFGTEAILARIYGGELLRWMRSEPFRILVWSAIAVALVGTAYTVRRSLRRA